MRIPQTIAFFALRGEVDVTLLGPAPLGLVNRACGAAPFLVPLGKDGKPEYHSMLLTGDPAITSIAVLLKLKPRESTADAGAVQTWDDEIKNGFMLPGPNFLAAVLRVDEIGRSLLHESR